MILFNSAWLRCCEASLGGRQCCCYHPSQVNTIHNSTFHVCLFFSLGNRNIPTYTVYLLDFTCDVHHEFNGFVGVNISLSLKHVCSNLTNQVSKTLAFPTPPTNGTKAPAMRRVRRFPTNCQCQCLPWSHQKKMAMM